MPNEALDNVVFALTVVGASALSDENPALTQELRAVLNAIDGICPVAQYVPFLRLLHPLEQKFLELERLGFITRIGSIETHVVTGFMDAVDSGKGIRELWRIDADMPASNFMPL
jgi:hypothetical protein